MRKAHGLYWKSMYLSPGARVRPSTSTLQPVYYWDSQSHVRCTVVARSTLATRTYTRYMRATRESDWEQRGEVVYLSAF